MSSITYDKEVLSQLEQLGLTNKEAMVYIALLGQAQAGSSTLIDRSGLHGQFVYQALKSLEEKGLISRTNIRGRNKFSAKEPSSLSSLIEHKKIIADRLADSLSTLHVNVQAQMNMNQGEASFINNEFALLHSAKPKSTLLIIGGSGDNFYTILGKRIKQYEAERLKKKISVRYLGSEGQRIQLEGVGRRKLFEHRLLPGLFTGEVNTNIWPDTISFNIFSDPVSNFTMTNIKIAESYRQFFETLWRLAK